MCKVTDDQIYGRSALKNGEPWIVPESLNALKSIIQSSWDVFEWGSGGSTVFWAKHCNSVVSIEHNTEWIKRTSDLLNKHEVDRSKVNLQYCSGKPDKFRSYADTIKSFGMFDLVYIDGEASSRGWCLTNALDHVEPGGYLLLDNSNWLKRELDEWDREDYQLHDLKWVGQPGTFSWWTSILRKKI